MFPSRASFLFLIFSLLVTTCLSHENLPGRAEISVELPSVKLDSNTDIDVKKGLHEDAGDLLEEAKRGGGLLPGSAHLMVEPPAGVELDAQADSEKKRGILPGNTHLAVELDLETDSETKRGILPGNTHLAVELDLETDSKKKRGILPGNTHLEVELPADFEADVVSTGVSPNQVETSVELPERAGGDSEAKFSSSGSGGNRFSASSTEGKVRFNKRQGTRMIQLNKRRNK